LNLSKLFKSYKDFGYSNIKQCYLRNVKSFVKQKTPKLFFILSDINRQYFGKYDKDILVLDNVKDYETKEKELFKEVFELVDRGMPGIINEENFQTNHKPNEYPKSYKYYSRQNKDHSNTKFYDEVNLNPINETNKPKLIWKHISLDPDSKSSNWKRLVETSPVYINGKLIYISADFKLIALNAENGKVLWEKELLHPPSMRGFIVEIDKNEDENLYICIGSKIYKLNAKNGNIRKNFGLKGSVNAWTAYSPVIFKNNLIVVSQNSVNGFDKFTGNQTFQIGIFKKKNFSGGLPWGGMALDENRGIIYFSTGNPRPKIYGGKRQGINEGSNSIIAVNVLKKK